VLYLHGGGYNRGSSRSHAELASRVARAIGGVAVVPDYRLAPEHPFPAALEDVFAAYCDLLDGLHVEPAELVVAGDSAGGGLVLAALLRARDLQLPLPACVVMFSPWLDLRPADRAVARVSDADPLFTEQDADMAARAYCGEHASDDPLVSPILADLRGLPPALVFVGKDEFLSPDARAFTDAARAADVFVDLQEQAGLFHVWPLFPQLPESVQAIRRVNEFTSAHLAPSR
jgi:acetyl esterase/lipase